ncbi:hypothetical protein ABIF65_009223 [Bradyrhizobium japonicum]
MKGDGGLRVSESTPGMTSFEAWERELTVHLKSRRRVPNALAPSDEAVLYGAAHNAIDR